MVMSFSDQVTIEKSPRYWIYEHLPERIYKMNKNIKLILIVRDPVTRTISDFYQTLAKLQQDKLMNKLYENDIRAIFHK